MLAGIAWWLHLRLGEVPNGSAVAVDVDSKRAEIALGVPSKERAAVRQVRRGVRAHQSARVKA